MAEKRPMAVVSLLLLVYVTSSSGMEEIVCPSAKPLKCPGVRGCTTQGFEVLCSDALNAEGRTNIGDDDVFCPEGHIFCSDRKRCEKVGTRCDLYCDSSLKKCAKQGKCVETSVSCDDLKADSCKEDICTMANLQLKVCTESFPICQKFSMNRDWHLEMDKEQFELNINKKLGICPPNKRFCPLNQKCQDRDAPCNKFVEIIENTDPVSELCNNNQTFCRLFGKCVPKGTGCAFYHIADYDHELNKFPYQHCDGGCFCHTEGRCKECHLPCFDDYSYTPRLLLAKMFPNDTDIPRCTNPIEVYCPNEDKCTKPWLCDTNRHGMHFSDDHRRYANASKGWIDYCSSRRQVCASAVATVLKCGDHGKLEDCPALKNEESRCLNKDFCQSTVKKIEVCKARDKICSDTMYIDPSRGEEGKAEEREKRRKIMNSVCETDGHVFCWKSGTCEASCSSAVDGEGESLASNPGYTPWGKACKQSGWLFCPVFSACIPQDVPCSLNRLTEMINAGQKLGDIFGVECPTDSDKTKFCFNTMSCLREWENCDSFSFGQYFSSSAFCNNSKLSYCYLDNKCRTGHYHECENSNSGFYNVQRGCMHGEQYCENSLQCRKDGACPSSVFDGVDDNDVDKMCKVMEFECPRILTANVECKGSCKMEPSQPVVDLDDGGDGGDNDPDIQSCNNHRCQKECKSDGCMNKHIQQQFCRTLFEDYGNNCMKYTGMLNAEAVAHANQMLSERIRGQGYNDFSCFDDKKPFYCPYNSGFCVSNFTTECLPSLEAIVRSDSFQGFRCPDSYQYCDVVSACIPTGATCSFNYMLDLVKDSSSMSCGDGMKFCTVTLSCIPQAADCDLEALARGMKTCREGSTVYCASAGRCVSDPKFCPVSNPRYRTGIQNGLACPINTTWCPDNAQCVPNSMQCSQAATNYPGIVGFCQHAQLFCGRVAIALSKCDNCDECKEGFLKCGKKELRKTLTSKIRDNHCIRAEVFQEKCEAMECMPHEQLCYNSPDDYKCIPKELPCCTGDTKLCGGACVPKGNDCPKRERCQGVKCADLKITPICKVLADECPIVKNITSLEAANQHLKAKFADICPDAGQYYCPWIDECVQSDVACTPELTVDITTPRPFEQACWDLDGISYKRCPITGQCVSGDTCSFAPWLNFINSVGAGGFRSMAGKIPDFQRPCSGHDQYYCPYSTECKSTHDQSDCALHVHMGSVDCHNGHHCSSAMACTIDDEQCRSLDPVGKYMGAYCEHHNPFCWKTMKCLPDHSSWEEMCNKDDIPMRKYLYQNEGFTSLCNLKPYICALHAKRYEQCDRCLRECHDGYYYCDMANVCIKEGQECTHDSPCEERKCHLEHGNYKCIGRDEPCCGDHEEGCHHWCIPKGSECPTDPGPGPGPDGGNKGTCFHDDDHSECKEAVDKFTEICAGSAEPCAEAAKKSTNREKVAYLKKWTKDLGPRVCDDDDKSDEENSHMAWCPFSTGCYNATEQPNYCNISLPYDAKLYPFYPWGERCPDVEGDRYLYCPFTGTCIHPKQNCTLKTLVDLIKNRNPVGIYCPKGQKLCLINSFCMKEGDKCEPDSVEPPQCPDEKYFCKKDFRCHDKPSDCKAFNSSIFGIHDLHQVSIACPSTHEYCEEVMSCHPKGQCPGVSSLMLPKEDDPDGYMAWCTTRELFCKKAEDTISKCIVRCQDKCGGDSYYCDITDGCVSSGDECGTCPAFEKDDNGDDGDCEKHWERQTETCAAAAIMCPKVADYASKKNGSYLFAADFNSLGSHCPEAHYYCPFALACLPHSMKCTYDAVYEEETNLLPWGGRCFDDMKYCPWFQTCVPTTVKCQVQTLVDWFGYKDPTKYPPGFGRDSCSANEKFCPVTMRCMKDTEYEASCSMDCSSGQCKSKRLDQLMDRWNECKRSTGGDLCYKSFECVNATQKCESATVTNEFAKDVKLDYEVVTGYACAVGQKFCPSTWSCVAKANDCPDPSTLVVANDPSGMFSFCKMKTWACRRTFEKSTDCIEKCARPCGHREFYCPTTMKCQSVNDYCDSPSLDTCESGTFYCDLIGRCIPNTESCKETEIGVIDKKCYFLIMKEGGAKLSDVNYDKNHTIPDNKMMVIIKLASTDMGKWKIADREITGKVTEENAWVTNPYSKIEYITTEPTKGLAMMLITFLDKSLFAAADTFADIRDIATKNNIKSITYHHLGIVVAPTGKPRFKQVMSSKHEIVEDSTLKDCNDHKTAYRVRDKYEFDDDKDLGVDLDKLGCVYHSSFHDKLVPEVEHKFDRDDVLIVDTDLVTQMKGKWYVEVDDSHEPGQRFQELNEIHKIGFREFVALPKDREVCYVPAKDESGTFKFPVYAGFRGKNGDKIIYTIGESVDQFELIIKDLDDPPVLNKEVKLPPLPFKLLSSFNGFMVAELLSANSINGFSAIKQLDKGKDLGVCIENVVLSTSNILGSWQFKVGSAAWKAVPAKFGLAVRDMQIPAKMDSLPTQLICLKPTDRIKFNLKNVNNIFGRILSKQFSRIKLRAWAINKTSEAMHGEYDTVAEDMAIYISKRYGLAMLEREGCDLQAGSGTKLDQCDVCGGDGASCVGCDGVKDSGAKLDRCRICTGGTTNREAGLTEDCNGRCNGTATLLTCGSGKACAVNQAALALLEDCNGVCNGKAEKVCDVCVGGNTGKNKADHEPDVCGVCGGDGSSCLDCEEVVGGGKKVDACGNCKSPDDKTFGKGCDLNLGAFQPAFCSTLGGCKVAIEVSVPDSGGYDLEYCTFGSKRASSANVVGKGKLIRMGAPSNSAGKVDISCTASNEATGELITITAGEKFEYKDLAVSSITDFTPKQFNIGDDTTVTITGADFMDYKMSCVGPMINGRQKFVPAVFVSATQITCNYKGAKFTQNEKLKIAYHVGGSIVPIEASVKLVIKATMPTPIEAVMTPSLNALMISFAGAIAAVKENFACTDLIEDISKLGISPSCEILNGRKLILKFGVNAAIKPADTLKVKMTSLLPRLASADVTSYVKNVETVTVGSVVNPPKLEMVFKGKQVFGDCEQIKLILKAARGSGGRPVLLKYSVEWDQSVIQNDLTADQNTRLETLNTLLQNFENQEELSFPGSMIDLDLKYNLVVDATNFLGTELRAIKSFQKITDTVPSVRFPSPKKTIKTFKSTSLKVAARVSECLDKSAAESLKLKFQWSIPGAPFKDVNGHIYDIEEDQIEPGKYDVECQVCMESDPTLCSTAKMELVVEGIFKAAIEGGRRRTINIKDTITLKPVLSQISKVYLEETVFEWEIKDFDDNPISYRNSEGNIVGFGVKSGAELVLDAAKYFFPEVYYITLTMRRGYGVSDDEISEFTQAIRVIEDQPAIIRLDTGDELLNAADSYELCGFIKNKDRFATVSYYWEFETDDDDYDALELEDDMTETSISGSFEGYKQLCFKLKPSILTAGSSYKLELIVDNGVVETFTERIITVFSPPTAGTFDISPQSGEALTREFTFTAANWFGDSDLVYDFYYAFTNERGQTKYQTLQSRGANEIKDVLPFLNGGDVKVYCKATDENGGVAILHRIVSVTQKELSTSDIDEMASDFDELLSANDVGQAESAVAKLKLAMGSNLTTQSGETVEKVKEVFKNVRANVLNTVKFGGYVTAESKKATVKLLSDATFGITDTSEMKEISVLLTNMIGFIENLPESRRKRRATEESSANSLEPKTIDEVESFLSTYDNTISPSSYDLQSIESKQSYLSSVQALGVSLCMSSSFGASPQTAVSSLVTIQAVQYDFADEHSINTTLVDTTTRDTDVIFSESVKNEFSLWSCESDYQCTGACLTAAQFTEDVIASANSGERFTDIIELKLYNPRTFTPAPSDSTHSYTFEMTLKSNMNASYEEPSCNVWNGTAWSTDGVSTTYNTMTQGSTVQCTTSKLTYLTVYSIEKIFTTIPPPTTTVVSTTIETSPVTSSSAPQTIAAPRRLSITFAGACSDFFNDTTKPAFEDHMRREIATLMSVHYTSLTNVKASCGSVIIDFDLDVSSAVDPNAYAQQKIDTLKNLVKDGNLKILAPNGKELTATDVGVPTEKKEEDDNTALIIGVVVGVLVLIIVIIVVVVLYKKSQKPKRKISTEKDNNGNAYPNPAYQHGGTPVKHAPQPHEQHYNGYPLKEQPPAQYPGMPQEAQYQQPNALPPKGNDYESLRYTTTSPPGAIVPNSPYGSMPNVHN